MSDRGFTRGDSGAGQLGGPQLGQEQVIAQVSRLLTILNSPTASPQQKMSAANQVVQLQKSNGAMTPQIQQLLQQNGWRVAGDQLVYAATGQAQSSPSGAEPDAGMWQQTMRSLQADQGQANARASQNLPSQGPMTAAGYGGNQDVNAGGPSSGAYGSFGGQPVQQGLTPGSPADPASVMGGGNYGDTFFGNVQGTALDALAGNPEAAWGVFKTRGGPGGGSLANSTAAMYGENDFESAMRLAPLLSSGLTTGADTLGFADSMMKQSMSGGGNYVDPTKLINAAFSNIANDPSLANQEMNIQTVLNAIQPYVDPTQYRMLQNRLGSVYDEYTTYGLENGTQDLNGELLRRVMAAMGM